MANYIPVAHSPYTLILKHYDIGKGGCDEEESITMGITCHVGTKNSALNKPPQRCLCVDCQKVNSLQQEV